MLQNYCKWKMIGTTECCNKRCVGVCCSQHNQNLKRGSSGGVVCLIFGVTVRGKTKLCLNCGGQRFRELTRYYKRKHNRIITEQEYIENKSINYLNKQKDNSICKWNSGNSQSTTTTKLHQTEPLETAD